MHLVLGFLLPAHTAASNFSLVKILISRVHPRLSGECAVWSAVAVHTDTRDTLTAGIVKEESRDPLSGV